MEPPDAAGSQQPRMNNSVGTDGMEVVGVDITVIESHVLPEGCSTVGQLCSDARKVGDPGAFG
jgi:hypothetical protein